MKKKLRHKLNLQLFAGNRIAEIETRKAEIRTILEGDGDADLDALERELRELDTEKGKIEKRKSIAAGITAGTVEGRTLENHEANPAANPEKEERKARELRGKDLKEMRAVTVGSSNIILPRHDSTTINPTFNQISSLIDRVTHVPLKGGESFRQPYETGYGEADYTAEGADYTDVDPTFAYVNMAKAKITSYTECTTETQKLPNADYESFITGGVSKSVRKKITRQILVGTGATNRLAGIFSTAAVAIDAATDLELETIDGTTLDEIIYSFGGDEDVEDMAVLVLNKKDLKAFAKLRDANGKKLHDIKNQGNTGTIDGVPFLINSACKAISDPASVEGDYAMAYGPLSNYSLAIFSDLDVQRSTDYKFKQGMIAHRGDIFVGGNVTAKNGFLRVKKAVE